jgi:hypothetical protein
VSREGRGQVKVVLAGEADTGGSPPEPEKLTICAAMRPLVVLAEE